MNNIRATQSRNEMEIASGLVGDKSWHAQYKDSAYVYVGGFPYELTEGDLIAVMSQCVPKAEFVLDRPCTRLRSYSQPSDMHAAGRRYGEIVDLNLVRDRGTGKSKGFCFVAYEDQRSTVLAVDNLNGFQVRLLVVLASSVVPLRKYM